MGTISKALSYPFHRFDGIFNYLWSFIPIIGPFVFYGYYLRVLDSLIHNPKASHKGLPRFVKFGENLKYGFLFAIALAILFLAVVAVEFILLMAGIGFIINPILTLLLLFVSPLLPLQYAYSGKFLDAMNIFKAFKTAFRHFGRYFITLFKIFIVNFLFFAPVFLVFLLFLAFGMLPFIMSLQNPGALLGMLPNLLGMVILFMVLIIPLSILATALGIFSSAYLLGLFYWRNRN